MTTDTMLPLIRELHDAGDHRARAQLLLQMPDNIVLKYGHELVAACRRVRFAGGAEFIELRRAALMARRGTEGHLPGELAHPLEALRQALARFVAEPPDTEP